jgi:MFS family permease
MAVALFVVPSVIGMVVEPLIFLAADRASARRGFVRAGVVAMMLACVAAAVAPGVIALSLAVAAMGLGIGTASGVGQAMLVDGSPDERARVMARWSLLSTAGDLLAPALLLVLAWRDAYLALAALLALWALLLSAAKLPEPPRDPPETPARLRDALRDRKLVTWLFACTLCELLDEILVVFGGIHVREDLGGSVLAQSITVAGLVAGGAIGLVALDRLLTRRDEQQLLVRIALACALAYGAWLAAPGAWACASLALPVGATAAPLYPLASSRAYATRPDASGLVQAAGHLFTPLSIAMPFAIGVVADHAGTWTALALLMLQPLGLAVVASRVATTRE